VALTQAGPGTIAEALIRGLPIILNDFIPGQVYIYAYAIILELSN
jgi:1,2-diacylglycerol 3-beta-galactosyltransferase